MREKTVPVQVQEEMEVVEGGKEEVKQRVKNVSSKISGKTSAGSSGGGVEGKPASIFLVMK